MGHFALEHVDARTREGVLANGIINTAICRNASRAAE